MTTLTTSSDGVGRLCLYRGCRGNERPEKEGVKAGAYRLTSFLRVLYVRCNVQSGLVDGVAI